MSKLFTRSEIEKHNNEKSAWIIIDTVVYDITKFAAMHPGGELLILEHAGKDATGNNASLIIEPFYAYHRQEVLTKYHRLKIGTIVNESPQIDFPEPGAFSKVPYAEPSALQGFKSPYYTKSHHDFRKAVRTFLHTEVLPEALASDPSGGHPSKEIWKKMGDFGLLAARMGPGPHLNGFTLPNNVKPSEFDYFYEQIIHEELITLTCPSYQDGLGAGMVIGLPPVMHFAKPAIRDRVVREVLTGEKQICLAITEPNAGSDVAAIKCTAKLTPDGIIWSWITNGTFCEYFTTAVVTDAGISMLLIERSEGLETKPIKTSYSSSAGTSYIILENVKVPAENLLGIDGAGFMVIMANFNHERWFIIAAIVFACRKIVEECFKWSNQRIVFGKRLIDQPVIRNKLAHMVAEVESVTNWLENMTYQFNSMTYKEANKRLAGPLALLKLISTRVAHNVTDHAVQIFGGRAITQTGMGRCVVGTLLMIVGSEEIMADLGIRQAMRNFPNARL
ncbi:hypothetical protein HDV02_001033 [Globomyces sp. JEL0801]|nr:hypothetical protein HDV02_001033 [Globomyces sp. JEL0801]